MGTSKLQSPSPLTLHSQAVCCPPVLGNENEPGEMAQTCADAGLELKWNC